MSVVPEDKSTAELKVIVSVVSTSIEPDSTVPVKVVVPFNLIFPASISVYPEIVFEPVNIKFAV